MLKELSVLGVISFVAMLWFVFLPGSLLPGLLLEKRWACQNLCVMGSTWSRLIPVLDIEQCKLCKRCEQVCLVPIPLKEYLESEKIS